ncbi:unnamed protein product [Protopolystoma xenopodis]|uniref:Uncharacterized protein n=1 Tax=Protopolystoma xenopodis TaxID=117903 RepID=A0A448XLR6_9PLAT|nr:unnamed protein product [Protopolystoma xenopodis]
MFMVDNWPSYRPINSSEHRRRSQNTTNWQQHRLVCSRTRPVSESPTSMQLPAVLTCKCPLMDTEKKAYCNSVSHEAAPPRGCQIGDTELTGRGRPECHQSHQQKAGLGEWEHLVHFANSPQTHFLESEYHLVALPSNYARLRVSGQNPALSSPPLQTLFPRRLLY